MLCAYQPAHPLSLINVFVIPCLESTIDRLAAYKYSRFWLVSVLEYVDGCNKVIKLFSYSTEHEIYPAHTFTNRINTISESLKPNKKDGIFFSILVLMGI